MTPRHVIDNKTMHEKALTALRTLLRSSVPGSAEILAGAEATSTCEELASYCEEQLATLEGETVGNYQALVSCLKTARY